MNIVKEESFRSSPNVNQADDMLRVTLDVSKREWGRLKRRMERESLDDIVNALLSGDNEGSRAPYWLILDPSQNMRRDIFDLASQISGPFFSRKSAQKYMDLCKHHYSDRARVFCHSGHYSRLYEKLCDELKI